MRVFSIHGWGGHPEEGWRPWLRNELEKHEGIEFINLEMPDTNTPTQEKWVHHLRQSVQIPTANDYFIGHSLGCITILRYLEQLKPEEKIGGAILIAGFSHDLQYPGYKGELSSFYQSPLDFKAVKQHCDNFVAIHSTNDKYVPLEHGDIFEKELGAKLVVLPNMHHFSGDDGITKLPVVLEELFRMRK